MTVPESFEFYKRESDKTLWVHICPKGDNLSDVTIRVNRWWKTSYSEYKMRICSKKEFDQIKGG
tara:strand:+ start:50 stop:241 length:192 start_codon:yes stop_codon:yes gene_type:complete